MAGILFKNCTVWDATRREPEEGCSVAVEDGTIKEVSGGPLAFDGAQVVDAGGRTLVDATNPDLRRDPEALRRISEATGLHVVMGAGHYVNGDHPLNMDERTEEELFAEIAGDVVHPVLGVSIAALALRYRESDGRHGGATRVHGPAEWSPISTNAR